MDFLAPIKGLLEGLTGLHRVIAIIVVIAILGGVYAYTQSGSESTGINATQTTGAVQSTNGNATGGSNTATF